MYHSVLPEEDGVGSRGQLSSSRRAVARQDRMAKRNPVPARACAGGMCPFFVMLCSCGFMVFRYFLLLRVRGSVWRGEVVLGANCVSRLVECRYFLLLRARVSVWPDKASL
ncbi:MAG: hypothetical protein IKO75_00270 [Bacteroidales bacterium]|nr:hypothetical protein [Bacteroidales bacterium]